MARAVSASASLSPLPRTLTKTWHQGGRVQHEGAPRADQAQRAVRAQRVEQVGDAGKSGRGPCRFPPPHP